MLIENCKLAFVSMAANKLRTFLTMLGIIIGIASVIAIMTVGNSQTKENERQLSVFGVNNISCYMWLQNDVEVDSSVDYSTLQPEFTKDMLSKMASRFADRIEAISSSIGSGQGKVTIEGKDAEKFYANVYVTGVTPGYFAVNSQSASIVAGRKFGSRELSENSYVAVVSNRLVQNLFDGDTEKAIGSKVTLTGSEGSGIYTYTIVGVYAYSEMAGGFGGGGSEKDISTEFFVPLLNARSITPEDQRRYVEKINSFEILAKPGTDINEMTTELQGYLTSLLPEDTKFRVDCYNNASWIEDSNKNMRQQTMMVTMIGAIALLVGGIGVMNIMTVSITERTKEIGTRKALGAPNGAIRMQFIVEAVLMSIMGGVFGMVIGIAAGYFVCMRIQHIPVELDIMSVWISFLFSFGIGVFFGFYPANKAAKMDPIEALRYE